MIEKVYDTIRGILYSKLPKNNRGEAVVFDRPIKNWFFGDRDVVPADTSIILYGTTSSPKDSAFGLREVEHRITLGVFASADNQEASARLSMEMARIIHQALLPHRRMWVLELCPICGKFSLSPEHFTIAHNDLLDPYITAVEDAFEAMWQETHDVSVPVPTLPDSGVAVDAFLRMYEDVRNNINVEGLTATQRKNIQQMQTDLVQPVRLLYNVNMSEVKPSDDGRGQALLHTAQFTISANEAVRQTQFGPDNVPTTAF